MRGITFKVVVEKNIPARTVSNTQSPEKAIARRHGPKRVKRIALLTASSLLAIGLVFFGWRAYQKQYITNMDPFTTHARSLANFPLYYPTRLPSNYHIDKMSVANPDNGVIVFNLTNSNNERFIYISEEAKPHSFNFGSYYEGFSNRINTRTKYGTAILGVVSLNNKGHEEVGSLTSNDTWLIANTTTDIPMDQLASMLKSLVVSQ
jgi:hypothetical protein